jgi:predicted nuclease of restriction endonuclease-like (RecB) superfamily
MQIKDTSYQQWVASLKEHIRSSQLKAAISVNAELLQLYWNLGQEIVEKEKDAEWGDKIIPQLAKDLLSAFPEMKGFSKRNLFYIQQWVKFYSEFAIMQRAVAQLKATENTPNKIVQQPVAQLSQQRVDQIPALLTTIPWGHHLQIITKCKSIEEACFYIQKTCNNNWSRSILVHQLESKLYDRKGKAVNNFKSTLPKPQSDLANELLKNPYQFDFLSIGEEASERDLENALADHLTKFLLELGAGFAYMGRQYPMKVEDKDYAIDLLFYHTQLHCYVVVELKIDEFKPEYAGKLNFYLTAVDEQLTRAKDEPTIGLLLCKKAGKLIVEYSLKNISKPIGVSEYKLVEALPKKLKGNLPSIEEIESELTDYNEKE